jgi:hypothetical protein
MLIRVASAAFGDKPFMRFVGKSVSFCEADDVSSRVAGWLFEAGVKLGNRVGIMLPNGLEFLLIWLGVTGGYAFTRGYVAASFDILDYRRKPCRHSAEAVSWLHCSVDLSRPRPHCPVCQDTISISLLTSRCRSARRRTLIGLGESMLMRLNRSAQNCNLSLSSIYYYEIVSALIANVRISLSASNKFEYSFFVRKVSNNPYVSGTANTQRFDNPYRLINVGRSRTIGIGLRYQF